MRQECYEIHVKGHLSTDWSDWFDGLTVTNLERAEACISGPVPDQAALLALLTRVHALNLVLLGLRRVTPDAAGIQACPHATVCGICQRGP